MARLQFFAALLVGILASATAQSASTCCNRNYNRQDSHYSRAGCIAAATFATHGPLISFFDAARRAEGFDVVRNISKCFQRYLSRMDYQALIMGQQSERANIASMVLGYGCIHKMKTRACDGLNNLLFNDGTHVLGLATTTNVTFNGQTFTLSVSEASLQCLFSEETATFDKSEFNQGVAQCAATGVATDGDDTTASIADYVVKNAPPNSCQPCDLARPSVTPFCGQYFTTDAGAKTGARCGKFAHVADQLAQSFHSLWMRSGSAKFGNVNVTTRGVSEQCKNVLTELSCSVTIMPCSSNTVTRMCKTTCESKLMQSCATTAADAAKICQSINAVNTGSECPATSAAVPAAVSKPVKVVVSTVPGPTKGTQNEVTLCLNSTTNNATIDQLVMVSMVKEACPTNQVCAVVNFAAPAKPGCARSFTATIVGPQKGAPTATQYRNIITRQTSIPATNIAIKTTEYQLPVIANANQAGSPAGSGQATLTVASSILLASLSAVLSLY